MYLNILLLELDWLFLHPQPLHSFSGDPAGTCSNKTVFSTAERLEKPAEDQP